MKTVCIFNPLPVLGNKMSVSDIDGLKIFKFYEYPEIRAQIEVMKTEVMKYQTLTGSIKSFEERKDNKDSTVHITFSSIYFSVSVHCLSSHLTLYQEWGVSDMFITSLISHWYGSSPTVRLPRFKTKILP